MKFTSQKINLNQTYALTTGMSIIWKKSIFHHLTHLRRRLYLESTWSDLSTTYLLVLSFSPLLPIFHDFTCFQLKYHKQEFLDILNNSKVLQMYKSYQKINGIPDSTKVRSTSLLLNNLNDDYKFHQIFQYKRESHRCILSNYLPKLTVLVHILQAHLQYAV